ncbi:hypothetical protein MMC07_006827 [Pseudocyphellaria aurata]|nr:hypothetical protein [Pseudocyphellaria aurata]
MHFPHLAATFLHSYFAAIACMPDFESCSTQLDAVLLCTAPQIGNRLAITLGPMLFTVTGKMAQTLNLMLRFPQWLMSLAAFKSQQIMLASTMTKIFAVFIVGIPLCLIGGVLYSWTSGKGVVSGFINAYGALYKIPGERSSMATRSACSGFDAHAEMGVISAGVAIALSDARCMLDAASAREQAKLSNIHGAQQHLQVNPAMNAGFRWHLCTSARLKCVTVIGEVNQWTSHLMNIMWLFGTFTFAIVLGVVTEDIVAHVVLRLQNIRSGNYPVITANHTLILNWNSQTVALLRQIAINKLERSADTYDGYACDRAACLPLPPAAHGNAAAVSTSVIHYGHGTAVWAMPVSFRLLAFHLGRLLQDEAACCIVRKPMSVSPFLAALLCCVVLAELGLAASTHTYNLRAAFP